MATKTRNRILLLSVPQALLIAITGIVALRSPGFYEQETKNWQAQSVGQDMMDVFLVSPLLIVSSFFSIKGNKKFAHIWAGTNLYLVYTYLIYCFDIHFNAFFIFYCIILGLSFYSVLLYLFRQMQKENDTILTCFYPARLTGIYFIVIACLFTFLWLSEIIPAIVQDGTPAVLLETGLFTNPVHVIDLAVFLPGLLFTGVLLMQSKPFAQRITPIILVFMVLMDITIGLLTIVMNQRGFESNLLLVAVMGLLAIFSLILFISFSKRVK